MFGTITQTGYQDIVNGLKANGFEQMDKVFVKALKTMNQIIVNNQPLTQEKAIMVRFEYLGEGAIICTPKDELLYGFAHYVGSERHDDLWVRNWNEMARFLNGSDKITKQIVIN